MTSYEIDYVNSDSDVDAVMIDRDDVSNYNPEQILPQPADIIQKIRAWLQPTSYDIAGGEYRKHLASHVSGTGSWLTSSDTYKQWLEDDQHGLLWIKGIPGSGKSVMAASLIDGLANANPGSPVVFFFFRQIIEANHQPEALLRDWMDQILTYSPPLQQKLNDYLESKRSIESISMEDLWKDLYMAFSGLSNRVFCVADALDEMDKGNESFLQALATLGKWKPQKVKVLITSRPVPTIEGPLRAFQSHCLQIRLQENMVDIDITTFVQFTLSRSTIPQADWKTIMDAVPGRANGLFLYAKLAMDAFVEPGADVKTVLGHLPADLNVLYTDLLKEHSRRSGVADSVQRLILQAVTHSARPLRLLELAEMIKANNPDGKERDLKATKDLIRAACGPLLEILADETVSVIHHSFTEYLKGTTRSDGSGYPVLKMGPTHAQLAVACLRYLTSGSLKSIVVEEEEYNEDSDGGNWHMFQDPVPKDEVQLRLKHPFFEYAAVNWAHHIRRSEAAEQDQTDVNVLVRQFLDDERDMKAWLQIKWNALSRGAAQGVTKIHIAAKLGLCSYLKELIQTMEPDLPDATGRTPLWWAAHEGHEAAVYELIEAGANPDQPESVSGLKPLHEAANLNHHAVVSVLLEAGVDPLTPKTQENPGRRCGNAPVTVGHTPLMYACDNGHAESVGAFLPFLKDIETAHRALAWAARSAKSKVVTRILQHPGVDVNKKVRGDTALYVACGTADVETIRCLLEAGADPRVQSLDSGDEFDSMGFLMPFAEKPNPNRQNCLHRLCESRNRGGHTADNRNAENLQTIFSLLVNAGADINQRDRFDRTPLHYAVSSPVLTRLLIQAGADANATDDSGAAPIHQVPSIDSMVVLIEEGHADINLAQKDGQTPLLRKLSAYHVETTLKFLEYGPDCSVTDRDGNGVFHLALDQWRTDANLLRALLKAGADPNAKNKAGLTPLLAMRRDFKPQLMDVLIEAGADINATDGNGRTVLFKLLSDTSASKEKYPVITQLIERGFLMHHRDRKGRTLLHEAILCHDTNRHRSNEQSRFDFVRGLGLDLHAVDNAGNGLLHELAMSYRNHDSYSGPSLVSLWENLLDLGLDLEQVNHDGLTPLHILCSRTSFSRFEQGVIMPIDVVISRTKDLDRIDNLGATPLHRAVILGELYSKKLLDAGADPTKATHEGLTPLHLASRCRQSNVVGLLLNELRKRTPSSDSAVLGVDAAASDQHNSTPLYYACLSGRPETVSLLLDAGADPKKGHVFSACASFEDEDQLWNSGCQEDEIFNDQLPLRLRDTRRFPKRGGRYRQDSDTNSVETTRLEEILEMCVKNGLEENHFEQLDLRFPKSGYISEAFYKGHDYTAMCLTAMRARNPALNFGNDEEAASVIGTGMVEEVLYNSSREARLQSFGASGMIQLDRINQNHLLSFLRRKEWKFIEKMAHEGVEFLNAKTGVTNFTILVSHGYTSLAETVGDIVVQKGFESGDWHAFGDKSRPGLWFAKRDISDPNKVAQNPLPLLIEATQRELPNLPMVKLLVEKFGVDINEMAYSRGYVGGKNIVGGNNSPLHSVSRGDHWWQVHQALPYLLEAGANINIRNQNGQTPLLMALKADGNWPGPFNGTAARLLIEAGADVNAVDNEGRSCLACARHDVGLVKLLISHGAVVTADSVLAAIDSRSVPMLQALLSGGASANIRADKPSEEAIAAEMEKRKNDMDGFGWALRPSVPPHEKYPLFHAGNSLETIKLPVTNKELRETETCIQLVQVLLEHGADPFGKFLMEEPSGPAASSYQEATVLHELFADGSLPEVYLRIPNLDVNRRDARGRTLLHAVCSGINYPDYVIGSYQQGEQVGDKTTVFQQLLSLGAEIEAVDSSSRNVLHLMIGTDRLHGFVEFDRFEASLAEVLKKAPHLMNQPDSSGETPLHTAVIRAASRGRPDIAEALLKAGADHLTVTKKEDNLLHSLASSLRTEQTRDFFEDLVKRGVDINARNIRGETPLFTFCVNSKDKRDNFYSEKEKAMEQLKAIPLMERLGADLFIKDNRGRGLLHAAAGASVDVFKQLMERGLDVMLEDEVQQTPIDVAAACGSKEILELFEKKI